MKLASPIHLLERDYYLGFDKNHPIWPPKGLPLITRDVPTLPKKPESRAWVADEWDRKELPHSAGGYLFRTLTHPEMHLHEMVVRFPSAPIFGSQSKTDFQVRLDPVHQHTLRLLTAHREKDEKPQIKKLFLLFNGLNEIDFLGFYYDLAGLLIENARNKSEVACLVAPFPAHLTRYPLIGRYAEKPLQRFISDPSDLFRQYLRFMVEMQWLMSVLVPVSYYPVASGMPLLEANPDPAEGRSRPEVVSRAIHKAWLEIHQEEPRGDKITETDVLQAVNTIRHLIGWKASSVPLMNRKDDEPLDPPQLHVIGYSLGGYLAQSVFFTWPYAIGSCSTLCSGGALYSLRPEKIVHEEEWRAITHGLKYEIDSRILEGRIAVNSGKDPETVRGIPVSFFASHFQTFNDIFLQDPYGSYRHRVSEFAPRLFFVVGGNDPIVPTRSVLETSPPEGINMIEIANLSHFIARDKGDWPTFWLPTIAGIISSLSDHSEFLLKKALLENLWDEETRDSARKETWLKEKDIYEPPLSESLSKAERLDAEPLDSEGLQSAILHIVGLLEEERVLLVLRNQIPVTLMGQRVLHRRGTVPHYADEKIRTFWFHLQKQRLNMLKFAERITIVVPGRLNDWFAQPPSRLSEKHLPVVREYSNDERQKKIWQDFLSDWENEKGALYRFNAEYPTDISGPLFELENLIRKETETPDQGWILNCLPDTWISLSKTIVENLAGEDHSRDELFAKLIQRMTKIHGKPKALEDWLKKEELQIIRISAAQSSPRFLGERIWKSGTAVDLLTHAALALARSQPCPKKGDFESGWKRETQLIDEDRRRRAGREE
jgi:hypothetical protein